MTAATMTRRRSFTDPVLTTGLIDSLPHDDPPDDPPPPGLRLTSQFMCELSEIGSRAARLAMLEAYERCSGDQWSLAISVHGAPHGPIPPESITRGLLELENAIRALVGSLADPTDRRTWIEIRPTAHDRRPTVDPKRRLLCSS